mmetsp:Transcript_10475/g.34746  ORF Transcript_10475/g.34746 Transcript_10475/m.34746 type:complete len:97 (-) Transcript_10475:16-306(-)
MVPTRARHRKPQLRLVNAGVCGALAAGAQLRVSVYTLITVPSLRSSHKLRLSGCATPHLQLHLSGLHDPRHDAEHAMLLQPACEAFVPPGTIHKTV